MPEWRECFETNYFGALNIARAALPHLRATAASAGTRPVCLFNTAIAALDNEVGFGAYGAAKAALEATAESLAKELAPLGVDVATVVLGPFRTDFIGRSERRSAVKMPEYAGTVGKFEALLHGMDGKQPGDPQAAARAILQMLDGPRPLPPKLILGSFAVKKVDAKLATLQRTLDEWRAVGMGCDFGK
jgi:NAD(P)-dependent dehydrogenase (short-subunit alcohol dehydrogenase family)